MKLREEKKKKRDLKIEKIKLEVVIDLRELEHIIFLKEELLITE